MPILGVTLAPSASEIHDGLFLKRPGKLIIDTDAGADDAMAILLTLASQKIDEGNLEILAFTCVNGNTKVDNVVTNVLKTLTIAKRSDIPVYIGAAESLAPSSAFDADFFGKDGLGDFDFKEDIIIEPVKNKTAPDALVEIINQYPGEVTILTLGPLTNIALAINLDSSFSSKVKQFISMSTSGKRGELEFNAEFDRKSYDIVAKAEKNQTMVILPLSVAKNAAISKKWRKEVFGKSNSSVVNFLNLAERVALPKMSPGWSPPDQMTAVVMLWPKLILKSEIRDPLAEVSRNDIKNDAKEALFVQSLDVDKFKEALLHYIP
ncbi:uridine nucleosidase 1 isoform X2 [Orussus abietinus]|uniref:uridine nucleosidase 1 isoform X2 n=1 Tax=Orussus abietinus TaxID=222816 RepID=UPI000626013E|nr:uridine nucleosidase 1 isoform X2 [Orussus abietinus]